MIMARKKRITVTIIIIFLIIVISMIIGGVILYQTTDMFKGNDVLFQKYAGQLIENVQISLESNSIDTKSFSETNKIESNITINAEYNENANINIPEIQIEEKFDSSNNYNYKNIKLVENEEELFDIENLQDDDLYGIRLYGIKQYISTKQTDNKLYKINQLINTKLEDIFQFSDEEITNLKSKYMNIVINNLASSKFSKKSGLILEINGKQYNTNMYSVTLTKEKFNNIYIQILQELEKDEIILSKIDKVDNIINDCVYISENELNKSIKQQFVESIDEKIKEIQDSNIGNDERVISLFESNGTAISLSIDTENYFFGIDNIIDNQEYFVNLVGNEKIDEGEKENKFDLKIQKQVQENKENVQVEMETIIEGEKNTNQIDINKEFEANGLKSQIQFSRTVNQEKLEIQMNADFKIVEEFEDKKTFDENYIIEELTSQDKEQAKENIETNLTSQLNKVSQVINLEQIDKILINLKLKKENAEEISNEGNVTELEKNKFNSNFEFYEGEEVSKEKIKDLINVVKYNLEDIRITKYEDEKKEKPLEYKLIIKKDNENEKLANEFVEYIEEDSNSKYSVKLEYDDTTGLVNEIYISVTK